MTRAKFKSKEININKILLDTSNARIRNGEDQNDCIAKIIKNEDQIYKLMESIVNHGLSTNPILVEEKKDGNYVVWDGNRRITALKLLSKPSLCKSINLKLKIENLIKKNTNYSAIKSVSCLYTEDIDALIQEVMLRHGGEQGGVGQVTWHAYMKTIFFINHKKYLGKPDYYRTGQYLLWAEDNGIIVDDNFKITNIQRFLNQENLRLLGFEIDENDNLKLIYSLINAKKIATKIINDFSTGIENVSTVFTKNASDIYIEKTLNHFSIDPNIVEENILSEFPSEKTDVDVEDCSENKRENNTDVTIDSIRTKRATTSTPKPTWDRLRLFPSNKNSLNIDYGQSKALNIVAELRRLKVSGKDSTPIAISMLFRALIEMSTNHYISINELKETGTLHKDICKVCEDMFKKNKLNDDQKEVVLKLSRDNESIFHIRTIQKFVHSESFHPNSQVLNTLFDQIHPYLKACWSEDLTS